MENLDPPHNKSKIGKWCVLVVMQLHLDFGVLGFLLFHFVVSMIAILDKIKENLDSHPPPNQKW